MSEPFHIVERESFRVAGYCIHTTNKRKEGQKAIPRQWEELQTQGQQKELMSHMNQEPFGLFGISVYNTAADDSRKFDHWIAVSSDRSCSYRGAGRIYRARCNLGSISLYIGYHWKNRGAGNHEMASEI